MSWDPDVVVTALLSTGAAAFVAALGKGYLDIRNGARARDRDTVGSVREQRDEAEARMRDAVNDRDFYHQLCAGLLFQLTKAGIDPELPAEGLVPPSQQDGPHRPLRRPRRRPPA